MTLALDIITQAMRESNLIALGKTPKPDEQAEGLKKLNVLVSSVLGYEIGEGLTDHVHTDIRSTPNNARVLIQGTANETFALPVRPTNGTRLQVIALTPTVGRTITMTGDRGGHTITNDEVPYDYLYRGDIARWVKLSVLTLNDPMPFHEKYDTFFEIALAMRLNPRYGRSIDQQSATMLTTAQNRMRAETRQKRSVGVASGLLRGSAWLNPQTGEPYDV